MVSDFREQHLHLKAPEVINVINPACSLKCIKVSDSKLILNGSTFIEGTEKSFFKSPGCGFTFLTSAHQVSLSGIKCVKMFYPVLTFLKVISSVGPLEGQMKACSSRTWGNDSRKPQAIPALGMLKVSVKIYNILLSNINTSSDVVFKKFPLWCSWIIKVVSWFGYLNVSLHNKHEQSSQFIGIFTQHMHRSWISWCFFLSTGDMPDFKEITLLWL